MNMNMNDTLKQATNSRYSTVEEAIPEYFKVLNYYKNLMESNGPLLEKELIECDVDISNNEYTEAGLFELIRKMGLMSYQVINHSYANCGPDGQVKTTMGLDVERIFIEYIVSLTNHILEIADYYYADKSIKSYLNATIQEGTRLANVLKEVLSEYE